MILFIHKKEIIKMTKKRQINKTPKPKEKYVTICPKCGSDDVQGETNPAYVDAGLFNQFKQCNNCSHHGQIFPEVPKSKVTKNPKKPEEVKDRQLVEPSLGKGYYKFIHYMIIIFGTIVLIMLVLAAFTYLLKSF